MNTVGRSDPLPPNPTSNDAPIATPPATGGLTPMQRLLLSCGVVGPLLFTSAYLIDGLMRPGYQGWRQPISALGLGTGGWVQSANFVVFGMFGLLFTVGLRRALKPGRGATWVPLLRAVGAVGVIADGVFAYGPLHQLGDTLTFTALPIACLVLARRFAIEPGWRGWMWYSIASGLAFWSLLIIFVISNAHASWPAGLFEKLAAGEMSAWALLLALRLLTNNGRLTPAPGTRAS